MNSEQRLPPAWIGLSLAVVGLAGVLLAGRIWPVTDDRLLKMSCYWAMKAVVGFSALLTLCGVAATAAVTRDAVRTAVGLGAATSLMQVFTIHILIPVMPHNVAHQEAHDLLSLLAVICCAVALSVLRPAVKIDEVLDAAAADEQPDVDGDEAPDTPEAPAQQPPT